MKSIIISLLCLLTITATAQTEKGNFLTGGSLTFATSGAHYEYPTPKSYYYDISPKLGYFVRHNLAIGAGLNFQITNMRALERTEQNNNNFYNGYTSVAYGLSPFIRYYMDLGSRFKFYGQFIVSGKTGTTKALDAQGQTGAKINSFKAFGVNLAPGLAFLPSKRWSFDLFVSLLDYERIKTKSATEYPGEKTITQNVTLGFDTFSPSIGVNYHF